jgi:serine/threonine protein kinase
VGEVYRVYDPKLRRDVALKILPAALAVDPDRPARFTREAQALASLNHPHIATIYGFEDSNSVHGLVMELVDGPTLADRIREGPRQQGIGEVHRLELSSGRQKLVVRDHLIQQPNRALCRTPWTQRRDRNK